jgi:hypothetical protein
MRLDLLVDTRPGASCNSSGEPAATDLSVFRPFSRISDYGAPKACIRKCDIGAVVITGRGLCVEAVWKNRTGVVKQR